MLRNFADKPASDEELACRAQRGCVTSFEQLLRRYQTPVLHFLRRRGAADDAEDLIQDTFLRAYENLHRYDQRWPFSAWLFTIARRASINHHRRVRPVSDTAALEAALAAAPAPLDVLVAAEDRRRLWDLAAAVLSEEQLTALWLRYVEEMPIGGIALVLGRSLASVKIMLFRARKKLLPLLGEFDHERQRRQEPEIVGATVALSPPGVAVQLPPQRTFDHQRQRAPQKKRLLVARVEAPHV